MPTPIQDVDIIRRVTQALGLKGFAGPLILADGIVGTVPVADAEAGALRDSDQNLTTTIAAPAAGAQFGGLLLTAGGPTDIFFAISTMIGAAAGAGFLRLLWTWERGATTFRTFSTHVPNQVNQSGFFGPFQVTIDADVGDLVQFRNTGILFPVGSEVSVTLWAHPRSAAA